MYLSFSPDAGAHILFPAVKEVDEAQDDLHKGGRGRGEPDPLGKYPDLHDATGYGEVDGAEGANCRHWRNVWIEGVSERTYTDE